MKVRAPPCPLLPLKFDQKANDFEIPQTQSPARDTTVMAFKINFFLPAVIAIALTALSYGVEWILSEVFPIWMLRANRNGKPTLRTESYAGRTALITGANGAYGSRAAKMFAQRDVETLVLVDLLDCAKLKEEIEAELESEGKGGRVKVLVWRVDMMDYASCAELGRKVRGLVRLDHVLLTAGILAYGRKESKEGWETCEFGSFTTSMLRMRCVCALRELLTRTPAIQVNYISTALLALLILPAMKSSDSNPNPPVLAFVTSFGIYPASPTLGAPKTGSYLKHLSNNKDGMAQAHQYGRSKALLLYFARELAARVSAAGEGVSGVTVNSADPGPAWTPLTQPNQGKLIPRLIQNYGSRDVSSTAASAFIGEEEGLLT